MLAVVHQQLSEVPAGQWNSLVPADAPFLRHEFLAALERTGCVNAETGWVPQHIVLHERAGTAPIGAVPLYLKSHSWGEFVFDWAWADAYQRAGLSYYPKLVAAVPFTPVTGPRLLRLPGRDQQALGEALIAAAVQHAQELDVSSLHWLFTAAQETKLLAQHGLQQRVGTQFHWENQGYADFDDYLAALSSKKRKQIKRERRRVREQGVEITALSGTEITEAHWRAFYRFYRATVHNHGAIPYLTREFFIELGRHMPEQVVLMMAFVEGAPVAAAFNLRGTHSLYGRYWGTERWLPDLHFELCYYRSIEYCIDHGLMRFEAGAQGEHKLTRGLMPASTHSAHWLSHPRFSAAIAEFLDRERQGVDHYMDVLRAHSPYRAEV